MHVKPPDSLPPEYSTMITNQHICIGWLGGIPARNDPFLQLPLFGVVFVEY